MSGKSTLLFVVLLVAVGGRAAFSQAALSRSRRVETVIPKNTSSYSVPHPVSFREVNGRGLLVRTWINGTGPFNFAIDTGAGATLLSARAADEARVVRANGRAASIAGLSGTRTVAYHASVESLALGDIENYLPAKGEVMITGGLPSDLDGVLDPTEALWPLGYLIDLPRRELAAFEPRIDPVQMNRVPAGGTVVAWARDSHGRRPFVMLDNGDRALLDTGSSLGLVIRDSSTDSRTAAYVVRDVGGGRISTRRTNSTTISIGSLTLQRIPTDLVSGSESDAPVLLGLAALRPFRIRFDPVHHLIEIAPGAGNRR